MEQDRTIIGVLIEQTTSISFKEVCYKYQIPEKLLVEMMEYGLFSSQPEEKEHLQLNQEDLRKIKSAFRLHQDLDINMPGVVLALELLEKIDTLHNELNILRKHF